jgi:hypothetical protein
MSYDIEMLRLPGRVILWRKQTPTRAAPAVRRERTRLRGALALSARHAVKPRPCSD